MEWQKKRKKSLSRQGKATCNTPENVMHYTANLIYHSFHGGAIEKGAVDASFKE